MNDVPTIDESAGIIDESAGIIDESTEEGMEQGTADSHPSPHQETTGIDETGIDEEDSNGIDETGIDEEASTGMDETNLSEIDESVESEGVSRTLSSEEEVFDSDDSDDADFNASLHQAKAARKAKAKQQSNSFQERSIFCENFVLRNK